MRRPSPWLLPAALAAGQLALWPGVPLLRGAPLSPAAAVAVAAITVVVAVALRWRRRAPVATAVVVLVALTAGTWGPPSDAVSVIAAADLIALYSVAVHRPRRVAVAVAAGSVTWQCVLLVLTGSTGGTLAAEIGTGVAVYLAVLAGGRRRARWHADRAAAAARLADAEARRARAADDERRRLARELHDVTAHHLTSIVVSVSAAQRLAGKRPELVAEALAFAARTGRDTLAALHRLVTLIGAPAGPPDLRALVADFRALGQAVELDVDEALPAEVAEAVAGIVREALTNALRYAPGAAVRVTVTRTAGAVRLTVDNDPAPPPAGPLPDLGGGRGVAGMRERAAVLGGTLDAGPIPGGGWRVHADLPPPGAALAAAAPDRRRPGHIVDAVLTAVALLGPAAALTALLDDPGLPAPGQPALVVLAAAAHAGPLLWRRRRPWTVLAAVAVTGFAWPALVAAGLLPDDAGWTTVAGCGADLLAVHAVARHGRRPAWDWAAMPAGLGAVALAIGAAIALVPPPPGAPDQPFAAVALVTAVLMGLVLLLPVVAAWLAGFLVRRRRERLDAREQDAVAVAAYRAWAGAAAERARVAAGLRVAVPRHTTAMVAAAEAGDLDGVLAQARDALAAMRGLLGGLRDEPEGARAPQPTLASVGALADRWRAHGRDVTVEVDGQRALPADVDVSAYRVVELVLAADTGAAVVRVDAGADPVRIAVTPAPADPDGEVAAGLRARAAAVGGQVRETPDGLEVRLPAGRQEVASSPSG